MSKYQDPLRINHRNKRFLGVCAGIADYLDMPVTLIRIITIICIVSWPTLILVYLGIYIYLNKNIASDQIYGFFNNHNGADHFSKLKFNRPIYRNMRNKRIAGVCSGIADYLEVSPLTVRLVAIASAFLMGPYALLAYLIAWFAMTPDPAPRYDRSERHQRRHLRKNRGAKRWSHSYYGYSSSRINDPIDESNENLYDSASSSADAPYKPDNEDSISKTRKSSDSGSTAQFSKSNTTSKTAESKITPEECADIYYALESRLREVEAFITSKKFRLHCEINRI